MGRMAGRFAAALLTVLVLLPGCDEAPKPPAAGAAPPPTVLVARVERQAVTQGAEFIGRVQAMERVDIRARVTGFLRERTFREGQQVNAGELIFLIEQGPFKAELDIRQAQIEGAEAALHNADLQVTRGRELVRTNAIPQATLDQRIADQLSARAQVAIAKASLEQARIQYDYTQIVTPIAGRIGLATLTPGNVVGPDSGVLTTVVREDEVKVLFPVSQRQILALRRAEQSGAMQGGLRVRVRLADGSLLDQSGSVSFINVTTDASTDSTLVQAVVPNPNRFLTDGQVVGVLVELEQPRQALVMPDAAVLLDQAGAFVMVVGPNNRVEQKRVRLSGNRGALTVIEQGLEEGAMVIVEGAQRARPGEAVTPRPAPQGPATGPVGAR
ncbi:MAG: efflux RND transporter periplasmic adaptor subunit [Acetobacteraceae bacterium]|nr:efflux RND transporter periplasmic adaptor subunit [Acetobacteraceae bacterium]